MCSRPGETIQTLRVLSFDALKINCLYVANEKTVPSWPTSVWIRCGNWDAKLLALISQTEWNCEVRDIIIGKSHSKGAKRNRILLIVRSVEPETRSSYWGRYARVVISPICPTKTSLGLIFCESPSRIKNISILPSLYPRASQVPQKHSAETET